MNQILLPCQANDYKPPVRSVSTRQGGQKFGVRLVFFDSLIDYMKSCETDWSKEQHVEDVEDAD